MTSDITKEGKDNYAYRPPLHEIFCLRNSSHLQKKKNNNNNNNNKKP